MKIVNRILIFLFLVVSIAELSTEGFVRAIPWILAFVFCWFYYLECGAHELSKKEYYIKGMNDATNDVIKEIKGEKPLQLLKHIYYKVNGGEANDK